MDLLGVMQVNGLTKYQTVNLLGIRICALRMEEVLSICEKHISKKSPLLLGVLNVAKLVNCRKNVELRKSLMDADLVLADGLPIVWLSKLIGDPLPERIPGIDVMYQLLELSSRKNYSIFFLGARKKVVQKVAQIIQKDYPNVRIAGYRDGYFEESESREVAEEIKNSLADIVFVGITSPKKENFLRNWRDFTNVPVCHGVGGSFDVLADVTKRAPFWMQKCGLEWLYRLIQEPRRMWKRYLVTNTIFIKLSLEAIIRARFSRLFRRFGLTHTSNAKQAE